MCASLFPPSFFGISGDTLGGDGPWESFFLARAVNVGSTHRRGWALPRGLRPTVRLIWNFVFSAPSPFVTDWDHVSWEQQDAGLQWRFFFCIASFFNE